MTMPHLSNCEHHDSGWCLGCVIELFEEKELAQTHVESLQKDIEELKYLDDEAKIGASEVLKKLDELTRSVNFGMPYHIRKWLELNDDVPAKKLKCPICKSWFSIIDHLAPYHWEACYCDNCKCHPLMPAD